MTSRPLRLAAIAALTFCTCSGAAFAENQRGATTGAVPVAAPLPLTPPAQGPAESPGPIAAPRMKVITLDAADTVTPRRGVPGSAADVSAGVVKVPVNKSRPLDLPRNAVEIVVGNPDIADVLVRAPNQVFLMGKAVGDTNVFFIDANGRLVRRVEVAVHQDVETLRTVLAQLLPDEYVEVSAFGDTITLNGTVASDQIAQQARAIARRFVQADAQVISLLRVAGEQQVLLRVRLAEVSRQVLKELDAQTSFGPFDEGGATIGPIIGGGAGVSNALGSVSFSHTLPMSIDISALETEGLAKTLAEPTLTAVSGEEARVFSGQDIPVVTATISGGVYVPTVEYRPVGVSLTFIPVVVGPGRISLKMTTEVGSVTNQDVQGNPIFSTRRAATAVELPSGGSMMIAGVLTHDMISGMEGVPGIMDIPVLGALFRSSSFDRRESELVVTVEAFIVQPTSPKQLALPSDGFAPASDLDRYLLGRLHEVYEKPALPVRGDVLQGPVGYIVQ